MLSKALGKLTTFNWSSQGLSINKILKMINGNRRQNGYKFAVWNCGRGVIADDGSDKLSEIQQFVQSRRPHCLGIIESDLFGIGVGELLLEGGR